jgi:hypothetical protein
MAELLDKNKITLSTNTDVTGIAVPLSNIINTNGITLPINTVNYPPKNTNEVGLKTNNRMVSLSPETSTDKSLLAKLRDGVLDSETIDVTSRSIDLVINVIDNRYADAPDIVKITYPKEINGVDFGGYDVDFQISFDTINTTYVEVGIGNNKLAFTTTDDILNLNVKDIVTNYLSDISTNIDEGGVDNTLYIPIYLTPINNSTGELVRGETESINVLFNRSNLNIPRSVAINRLAEGFNSQFGNCEFDDSKLLTHLLHLGNGDNKVITTWVGSNDSLILKLYEPLPTSVQLNDKVWITKVQAEPIIETVTLVGDDVDYCPPLKGANFSLEPDNGIGYQVYNELLASGSTTNTALIQQYISKTGIDTGKLNIEYASDAEYIFENFVNFGSAEERIKNFWYKIKLLESYQKKFNELTTISTIQANKQLDNINNLIGTFDGFEMWLYTSTDTYPTGYAYPKNGNTIKATSDPESISWYNSSINDAALFDRNNVNYLNNNLPEFIREDFQNSDFMLFMDMIGHHFDILWVYINALTKLKHPQHKSDNGFSNELVYHMLESLGWNGKKAFDSQFLWEYALGLNKNGTEKYQQSLKSANEEIWRRILNNLPYLLKHKGTSRSIRAVMACYGVPSSLLTIMEFGGPIDPTKGSTQPFTFEDRASSLIFSGSQYLDVVWDTDNPPLTIQMNLKFNKAHNHNLVKNPNSVTGQPNFEIEAIQTTGSFGVIRFSVSSSSDVYSIQTPERKLFDGEYKTVTLTNTITGTTSSFDLHLKQSTGDRLLIDDFENIILTSSVDWGVPDSDSIYIGSSSYVSLDEFRLWSTPLNSESIITHTKLPDATNGNSFSASVSELLLRHDFEKPKNRFTDTEVINVAISDDYNVTSSIAVGFTDQPEYPFSHETFERVVTIQSPSLGFTQSDKIRFETQELVGDLSYKVRATKKSFDRAPIDSSRLGLFFSPNKEVNLDIMKSFGNLNIDNFIGAPTDEYKDEYTGLKKLREFYFARLNRDIYEYIRLIRYIDKSLFDVIVDLVPARAKLAKGLLIEPHYLERSKTRWERATSERGDYETDENITVILDGDSKEINANIDADLDVNISHQYDNYDTNVDVTDVDLVLTTPFYHSEINLEDTELVIDYPTYASEINVPVGDRNEEFVETFTFEQIGMGVNSLETLGFGLYAPIPATGSITTIDIFGNITSSQNLIFRVKEEYIERIRVQTGGWPATQNDEQVEFELQDIVKTRFKITILPVDSPAPTIGNNVVEVTPLNGYFPTHYRYKNNLSEGLQQSFFKGSHQTARTTPDGLNPVEIFTTNPNILRVANTGRGSGEPVLQAN